MKDKITVFVERLQKLNINVTLVNNFPWVYIDSINGNKVTEKYKSDHGFTVAFLPIRPRQNINFTSTNEIFYLIRKYINPLFIFKLKLKRFKLKTKEFFTWPENFNGYNFQY